MNNLKSIALLMESLANDIHNEIKQVTKPEGVSIKTFKTIKKTFLLDKASLIVENAKGIVKNCNSLPSDMVSLEDDIPDLIEMTKLLLSLNDNSWILYKKNIAIADRAISCYIASMQTLLQELNDHLLWLYRIKTGNWTAGIKATFKELQTTKKHLL